MAKVKDLKKLATKGRKYWVPATFLMLGLYVVMFGVRVETFRNGLVSAGEIRHLQNYLFAHRDLPAYLTVFGKTYRNVTGGSPHYLEVPELNSILFVTEPFRGKRIVHLVRLDSKEHIQFAATFGGFGSAIGGKSEWDKIESVGSNHLVLSTRSTYWKEVLFVNMSKWEPERLETTMFDSKGSVTNQSIVSDPKYWR